jgi:DNA-binding PadR family transcriptional regulator
MRVEHNAYAELSRLQRDLLWMISNKSTPREGILSAKLGAYHNAAVSAGDVYYQLSKLNELDLVVGDSSSGYSLTEKACRMLEARRTWEAEGEIT